MRASLQASVMSGRRAVALAGVVLAVVAGTAQASPSFSRGSGVVSYYGMTSQDSPLVIQTSKDGRIVKRAIAAIDMTCTGGPNGQFVLTEKDRWDDVIVALNRSFKQSFSDSTPDGGGSFDTTAELTGRFDRKRNVVSGTWRLQFVMHDPDGTVTTCESGVQRFTARRTQV